MNTMKKVWDKLLLYVNRAIEIFTAFLLIVMVVLVFIQIVSRVIYGSSFAWTEEIARFAMIWITFLGAAIAFKYGAHIGIDVFVRRLPRLPDKVVGVFASLMSAIFFIVLAYQGWKLMGASQMQTTPALRLSMSHVYAIIPISACFMLLNLIDVTVKRLTSENVYAEERDEDL